MRYRIAAPGVETREVEAGTVEDALREFNARNGVTRTFKQCTIEELAPVEAAAPEPPPKPIKAKKSASVLTEDNVSITQ